MLWWKGSTPSNQEFLDFFVDRTLQPQGKVQTFTQKLQSLIEQYRFCDVIRYIHTFNKEIETIVFLNTRIFDYSFEDDEDDRFAISSGFQRSRPRSRRRHHRCVSSSVWVQMMEDSFLHNYSYEMSLTSNRYSRFIRNIRLQFSFDQDEQIHLLTLLEKHLCQFVFRKPRLYEELIELIDHELDCSIYFKLVYNHWILRTEYKDKKLMYLLQRISYKKNKMLYAYLSGFICDDVVQYCLSEYLDLSFQFYTYV